MRKSIICAAISISILSVPVLCSAYSQSQIENSINKAFSWQENNASPNSLPGSNSSDYYIMALSRMNKEYDFDSYVRITDSVTPSTTQDGQRLIMANSACGAKLSNSFVGMFTYDSELSTASDISGALITLDSGEYSIVNSSADKNSMVSTLMSMQQSNGSFENNVLSTAKAIIALSNYRNTVYELQISESGGTYTYNTDDSISYALGYISSNQKSDGGFGSIMDTAYAVMALNSVGVDADTDSRFLNNGNSAIGYLISMQYADGSFQSSPDDTAIASCALASQLRAIQGKSKFFDFHADDTLDPVTQNSGSTSNNSAAVQPDNQSNSSAATASPVPTQNVIHVTPMPTMSPEHSAVDAELYGPFPFVGPIQQEKSNSEDTENIVSDENSDNEITGKTKGIIVLSAVVLLMAASVLYLYKSQPEIFKSLFKKDNKETEKEKFVQSEEVNSYIDNFEQIKTPDDESPKDDDDSDDEYVEIPKF